MAKMVLPHLHTNKPWVVNNQADVAFWRPLCNLLLRSLVEEAKGEIWSYPICTLDRLSQERGLLPVKNVTGDERAHAQNKSFILDV